MSGHSYITSTNPFDDDDEHDITDEDFLKNSRRNNTNSTNHRTVLDDNLQTLKDKRAEIENRTIQSTERSIGILHDSEQIGIATAEELSRQREQLERTDKRLDEINQTLRFSQKHINGIKSVFSSLKNYVQGRNIPSPVSSSATGSNPGESQPSSEFSKSETGGYGQEQPVHPVQRLREQGIDHLRSQPSGSREITSRLDANLQEMCTSISRLKGLASNLGSEIDSQNELLDNITDKTEVADMNIGKQNKEINKLMRK